MGGICEVRFEMGSVATICNPSFKKIGSGIQNMTSEHADRLQISYAYSRKVGLKYFIA
jgi:hypothetical protein